MLLKDKRHLSPDSYTPLVEGCPGMHWHLDSCRLGFCTDKLALSELACHGRWDTWVKSEWTMEMGDTYQRCLLSKFSRKHLQGGKLLMPEFILLFLKGYLLCLHSRRSVIVYWINQWAYGCIHNKCLMSVYLILQATQPWFMESLKIQSYLRQSKCWKNQFFNWFG